MILEKSEIEKIENADTLIENYKDIDIKFSCTPNRDKYPFPKIGSVIDEEQSVRWNREKVDELRNAFYAKEKELQKTKRIALNDTVRQIKRIFAKDYSLSAEEVEIIWAEAYEFSGYMESIYSTAKCLAEMYGNLLEVRKKN